MSCVQGDLPLTKKHCIKGFRIWSFCGTYFPAFGLNTERYFVSLRIQSKCGKIQSRKISNTDTINAVKPFCLENMT